MTALSPMDRLRRAAENETIRASLIDTIGEAIDVDALREWVEAIEGLIDATEIATDAVETWDDQEDRELRADARDEAIDALTELVAKLDEVETWAPIPDHRPDEVDADVAHAADAERGAANRAWIACASADDLAAAEQFGSLDEYPDEVAARRAVLVGGASS